MKFCRYCGSQVRDEAVFCPNCGCATKENTSHEEKKSALQTVAMIFMILGCVAGGFMLIPLCWCIPMTVIYANSLNGTRSPVGLGFKICTLIFVSLVAGILMLCDDDKNYENNRKYID